MEMKTSESIATLVKAMVKFSLECPPIHKEIDNDVYRSKYADLAAILKVVKPVLGKNGLIITQFPVGGSDSTISLVTQLSHESGEFMRATFSMKLAKEVVRNEWEGQKKTPIYGLTSQGTGKGITYAMRYGIGAVLNLQIDEDDDGNSTSGKTHESPQAKPEQAAKPSAAKAPKPATDQPEGPVKLTPEKIEAVRSVIAAVEPDKAEAVEKRLLAIGIRQEVTIEVWGELLELFLKRLADISDRKAPSLAAIANKIPPLAGMGALNEARRKSITDHITALSKASN